VKKLVMKKIFLVSACLLGIATINRSAAQVRVNVNVNIGSQPQWGPSGYDYVDYYYMPDIETYYYVPTRQFIYLSGGNWVFATSLPARYRSYNLYSGYKVVVNQPKAYLHYHTHKVKYSTFRGNRSQVIIKNHKAPKYYKHKSRKSKGHGKRRH
jgi:hypothetical protein